MDGFLTHQVELFGHRACPQFVRYCSLLENSSCLLKAARGLSAVRGWVSTLSQSQSNIQEMSSKHSSLYNWTIWCSVDTIKLKQWVGAAVVMAVRSGRRCSELACVHMGFWLQLGDIRVLTAQWDVVTDSRSSPPAEAVKSHTSKISRYVSVGRVNAVPNSSSWNL